MASAAAEPRGAGRGGGAGGALAAVGELVSWLVSWARTQTMKLLDVNQTDVELTYAGALVKLAIPVGFRPEDRYMSADAKKSMKSLGMAILYWDKNRKPIPVQPQESLCTIS